ncbi:MAG: VOC family protein [Chloroflexi bacterium]|nr:VOC family protein [Chloroflexota bacterium]
MSLELYMVGLIVEDMRKSVEFYRRLGMDIPEGSEEKQHIAVKMNGLTFFLNTKQLNARWDPARTDDSGGYRIILEFYLKTPEAVDAKYNEMVGFGYPSHVAPYETFFDAYFAMIDDPDGNTILLSAFEEQGAAES